MTKYVIITAVMLAVMAASCERHVATMDPVQSLPNSLPVPVNLASVVDQETVTVTWEVTDSTYGLRFRIYIAEAEGEFLLRDSTTGYSSIITGLRLNQRYYVQIAAVTPDGLEGDPSDMLPIDIMLVSVEIEDGAPFTNVRDVVIQINAQGLSHIKMSEQSDLADAEYRLFSGTGTSFRLSDGDGTKTVYVMMMFETGAITKDPVSDDIILDTRAIIDEVSFSPSGRTLSPNETVTFTIDTDEHEKEGYAAVTFGGRTVTLYDENNNGIYDAQWVVPPRFSLKDEPVIGAFTDATGNQAPAITCPQLMNINTAPDAVTLFVAKNPADATSANLWWTESDDDNFESYRLYYKSGSSNTSSSPGNDDLLGYFTDPGEITFSFSPNASSQTEYHFRIFVFDEHGIYRASSDVEVTLDAVPIGGE